MKKLCARPDEGVLGFGPAHAAGGRVLGFGQLQLAADGCAAPHACSQQQKRLEFLKNTPANPISKYESIAAVVAVVFLLTLWLGWTKNTQIAQAWIKEYAGPGSILEKNFAVVGSVNNSGGASAGTEKLVKVGAVCVRACVCARACVCVCERERESA